MTTNSNLEMQNNQLLKQARSSKWLPPWWVVVPVGFLIPIIASFGGIVGGIFNALRHLNFSNPSTLTQSAIVQSIYPQNALEQVIFLSSSFAGVYLLLWIWIRWIEKRPFKSMGLTAPNKLSQFGWGLLIGAGMFSLAVGALWAMGNYRLATPPMLNFGAIIVLAGWLVQGPAEELLFRGWILPVLAARYRMWVGVFLSAAMFAVMHSLNPNLNVIAVLNLFLFGVFTALFALRQENVWGVFGIHAVWNWVQGNVFGLPVSGMSATGGTLLSLTEAGADWLTGGAFGPEGGAAVSVVLGVGIIWILSNKIAKEGASNARPYKSP